MTAEELRELADTTESLGAESAAAHLRACADAIEAGPVAFRMLRKDDGFVVGLSTVEYPEHRLDAAAKGGCEAQPLYHVAMPAHPPTLRLPEPMTKAEFRAIRAAARSCPEAETTNWFDLACRALEARTLHRVKECNK